MPGDARVWCNGIPMPDLPPDRDEPDAERELPVEVDAGWNTLLIELRTGGRTGRIVTLRATDPDALTFAHDRP
jgi:hypothetical protein